MGNIKLDETIFSMRRLLMTILWPSFLVAGISVGILFSMVDPETLLMRGSNVELNDVVVYTIAFFIFWFLSALSSGLTALLMCKSR